MSPSLAVFDLDGTLLDSTAVDTDACFFPALRFSLGLAGFGDDWTQYPEATSAGVFAEVIRRAHDRAPVPGEVTLMQEKLEHLMRAEYLGAGGRIPPVAGAPELLTHLRADPGWRIAVATGNWRVEAVIKLESAGLELNGTPMATADDTPARRDILALAIHRASEAHGVAAWERVVYVGDRTWDAAAARANGAAFLGVGTGARAGALHAAGARAVTRDLTDPARVVELLRTVELPVAP